MGAKIRQLAQQWELNKLWAYFFSFGWLLLERGLNLVLGMVVAIWLARYLQPEAFGIYNYAVSFVALFGFLSYLGLDGIVTRDLVKHPETHQRLLGTVFVLRLGGGLIAIGLIAAAAFLFISDVTSRWLIVIISASLLFDAFNVVDFWFQSRVENKFSAAARSVSIILGGLIYIGLIVAKASLTAFGVAFVLQQAGKAAALWLVYRYRGYRVTAWEYNGALARSLLRQSWPLIISSAGSLIYLKIDQIMLGNLVGAAEVGIYSAAVKLSEVWYVIPALAATAIFPAIVHSKGSMANLYQERLQRAYTSMAWLGIAIAIFVSLTANFLILWLYSDAYSEAGLILAIHIWTCPIMFMGPILSKWLIVEDLLIFSLTRHGLGAIANIILNLILIPQFGGVGAAVATLISYSTAVYLACFTDSRTRIAGKLMTRALFAPLFIVRNALR
ncbi:MAG: O-unit flippase [Anaerolineaceae bacterium]|nr:O-unit flippase [Anaerolineaceae bacterium]